MGSAGAPGRARRRAAGKAARSDSSGPSPLIKDHLAGGASRLAALLLPQILPVFSVVAPCHPGAALRDLVFIQRGRATRLVPQLLQPSADLALEPAVRRPIEPTSALGGWQAFHVGDAAFL